MSAGSLSRSAMRFFRPAVFLLLFPLLFSLSCAKQNVSVARTPDAAPVAAAGPIHLEAEQGTLTGNTVQTHQTGFTGSGYVGGFEKEGAKIAWTLPPAASGLYTVTLHYSAPFGEKGYDLVVNGKKFSGMFPATGEKFALHDGGKVELAAGANTLEIQRGWGYYEIDAVDLVPAAAPAPLTAVPEIPSDPQATPQARALLHSLVQTYGAQTLSGQYGQADTEYLRTVTGRIPVIMGGDLMDYSPSRLARGADPKGESERLLQAARSGQRVTISWHWNAPTGLIDKKALVDGGKTVDASWYSGFRTYATTFDVQKALADPGSADYKLLLRDIDAIAVQLQKFSDAGVPVLWRPLHEAEGGWFWWGAKGPESFQKLWRLMHERLTKTHGLHNLIWVYSSGTKPAWYPGDDVVDIVGIDKYPDDTGDPLSGEWDTLIKHYGSRKPVALTEFGGVPDIEKMRRYGVRWLYFVSWSGKQGPHKMSSENLTRLYHEPAVVMLGSLDRQQGKP